jgi:hypothetical protein
MAQRPAINHAKEGVFPRMWYSVLGLAMVRPQSASLAPCMRPIDECNAAISTLPNKTVSKRRC